MAPSLLLLMRTGLLPMAAVWLLSAQLATAAYPTFTGTTPRGAQRGTDVQLTITGDRLGDFERILFYTPGITQKSVEKVEEKVVECTISIAPDVNPGKHLMRLVTRSGISHGRQFMVGHYPNVKEEEPNNDLENAQPIDFNQTIEGLITSEDVDYFKISAKKDQRISLEVEGLRIAYGYFDPYIAILDKDRFEKAVSDDTILHKQDGYLSWVPEEDGDYYIMVRDSSYRGNNVSHYRLHVGSFRRPEAVFPAGAKAGVPTKVTFIENDGSSFEEEVSFPVGSPETVLLFPTTQEPPPSGNPFRVVDFDNTMEVEPNNSREQATLVTTGDVAALNGIINEPGDVDFYKMTLKKGQKLLVQGFGQALGSPIDMVVNIYNSKGGSIGGNDDGGGERRLDAKATIDIPEDDDYYIRVADHLERGGPNFVYRIELAAAPKVLTFSSPNYNINDSHYRQFIPVTRGGRFATLLNISRSNVSGDFDFEAEGLPEGVKMVKTRVPANATSVPLLFECAPDAPISSAVVPLKLKPVDPAQGVTGKLRQPFDVVRVGNVIYLTETHDRLPVAAVEEAPYSLEIVEPAAPLPAGGVLELKVVAKRKEGFKAPIRVLMVWKPTGVSTLGEVTIPENGTECVFVLDAKPEVPIGKWDFTVLGEADAGNGRVYNASPFRTVETVPAYLTAPAMALAAVEQGQETQMLAKVEHAHAFDGEATATVIGVPDTIQIEPTKITKGTQEVLFKVVTTDKSPVSKQGNLFVKVDIPVTGGGTATHRIAVGSTLRIDPPKKAPAEPAAIAAAPAKPAEAAPKPLSRLEQLRQEAAAAK